MNEPYKIGFDGTEWYITINDNRTGITMERFGDADTFIKHMNWVANQVEKEDEQPRQQAR
jgi:hypothetical protein